MRIALLLVAMAALQSCEGPVENQQSASAAEKFELAVDASPTGSDKVHFAVTTNIPLPVEVMATVSLTGQKDDDVYIGTDNTRITLDKPTTEFDLRTVDVHGEPLPEGEYEAEVSFYPRWGAKNEAAKDVPETEAVSTKFSLTNKSRTADEAKRGNEQQRWVMENVISGTPWDEGKFVAQLGKYEKSPATLSHLHDAYYFAGPDMTLIVNRLKGEVTVWRKGRATS